MAAIQTHAERTLAILEQAIENQLTQDVASYQIEGRRVDRIPAAELVELYFKYKAIVDSERIAQQVAAGLGNPRKIRVRLL